MSLATTLPLSQILADLIKPDLEEIEQMYQHIYWKTWHALSSNAQALLLAMPLTAEDGARSEQLKSICNLPDDHLWPAIQELTSRSLLEVRGTTQERRYGIHRLTETFLRTEIIHWPEEI